MTKTSENFAGVDTVGGKYVVAIQDRHGELLLRDTRIASFGGLASQLSTYDVGICVVDRLPEPSLVDRLREVFTDSLWYGVSRFTTIVWGATFAQFSTEAGPARWDFQALTVEVNRGWFEGQPPLECDADILCKVARMRTSTLQTPGWRLAPALEVQKPQLQNYVVRLPGGLEVAERASSIQVMDGCLALEHDGSVVAAWGVGAWESVRLAKEANSDEAI